MRPLVSTTQETIQRATERNNPSMRVLLVVREDNPREHHAGCDLAWAQSVAMPRIHLDDRPWQHRSTIERTPKESDS